MSMNFSKLLGQLDQVAKKGGFTKDEEDTTYWRLDKDKAGNGEAVIHFLPNSDPDDFPFVRRWSHGFKNKVGDKFRWYIETSLSTIGEVDYVAEVNQELYNSQTEENKAIAKNQKRKLSYISNILVIKDPNRPENEGRVFKFAFGQKIFDKIVSAAKPPEVLDEDADPVEPINAFDPYEGANFNLKMAQVDGFPNYDKSTFSSKRPMLKGDEDKIKEVLSKCYDLNIEVSREKMKSYDELKKRYLWVMGLSTPAANKDKPAARTDEDDELDKLAKSAQSEKVKTAPKAEEKAKPKATPAPSVSDDDDDEFLKSLIND
jgi:hypothetical protein